MKLITILRRIAKEVGFPYDKYTAKGLPTLTFDPFYHPLDFLLKGVPKKNHQKVQDEYLAIIQHPHGRPVKEWPKITMWMGDGYVFISRGIYWDRRNYYPEETLVKAEMVLEELLFPPLKIVVEKLFAEGRLVPKVKRSGIRA